MSRFDVMLVHGTRSESPVTPGIARAASMVGVKWVKALVVLTWSIAHVPVTGAGIDAWATTAPWESAAVRGSAAVSASSVRRRCARAPELGTVAEFVCEREANMDTS